MQQNRAACEIRRYTKADARKYLQSAAKPEEKLQPLSAEQNVEKGQPLSAKIKVINYPENRFAGSGELSKEGFL